MNFKSTKEHTSISSNENRLEWNVCLCSVALFFFSLFNVSCSYSYSLDTLFRRHNFRICKRAYTTLNLSLYLFLSVYVHYMHDVLGFGISAFFLKKMNSIQQSVLNDYLPIVYCIPKLFILIL